MENIPLPKPGDVWRGEAGDLVRVGDVTARYVRYTRWGLPARCTLKQWMKWVESYSAVRVESEQ